MNSARFRPVALIATVLLAAALWFVTFYLAWSTFWIKISLSAATLAAISLWLQPDRKKELRFNTKAMGLGVLSAALLYVIFWVGKMVSTSLFSFAGHQIGGIYAKGAGTSMLIIALLLLFITGPSEEIYWRGYLQKSLMTRFGNWQGWLMATALYAGVHIWSFNFMLIGAAGVAGAFWGFMYWRLKNLAPVIISHSFWSMFVFAIFPIN